MNTTCLRGIRDGFGCRERRGGMVVCIAMLVVGLFLAGCGKKPTPCVTDGDCPDGSHCNQAVKPPECLVLYSGAGGSACSENAMCENQKCENGFCWIECDEGEFFERGRCVEPREIEWVRFPGGTFQMGSSNIKSEENDVPRHTVTISAFEISKTEVTVDQFRKCVQAGVCSAPATDGFDRSQWCNWGKPDRLNHPVNCVDFAQAAAFAGWAGVRLPTEAEWEYAARSGGKDIKYPWGDEPPTCELVVMDEGDPDITNNDGCGLESTWPVCSKPDGNTDQGLCDMAGNVSEWISDWLGPYGAQAVTNPRGPSDGSEKLIRGGSWGEAEQGFQTIHRYSRYPSSNFNSIGFRLARSVN